MIQQPSLLAGHALTQFNLTQMPEHVIFVTVVYTFLPSIIGRLKANEDLTATDKYDNVSFDVQELGLYASISVRFSRTGISLVQNSNNLQVSLGIV